MRSLLGEIARQIFGNTKRRQHTKTVKHVYIIQKPKQYKADKHWRYARENPALRDKYFKKK